MLFTKKDKNILLPKHIAVVMDGNGRWAKKRGLPRTAGHVKGAANFRTITRYASNIGVKYFTVYAFSTENWNRPKEEVDALMKLFKDYLSEAIADFKDENIKINFLGDISGFSSELQDLIRVIQKESASKDGMVLNLAMNYGGRAEITRAVNILAQKYKNGEIDNITQESINDELYTANQPDPDLIIRPSGEKRISNFLLWQCAYSEFVYFDILWPDFKTKDLDKAIDIYTGRNRRFGGV